MSLRSFIYICFPLFVELGLRVTKEVEHKKSMEDYMEKNATRRKLQSSKTQANKTQMTEREFILFMNSQLQKELRQDAYYNQMQRYNKQVGQYNSKLRKTTTELQIPNMGARKEYESATLSAFGQYGFEAIGKGFNELGKYSFNAPSKSRKSYHNSVKSKQQNRIKYRKKKAMQKKIKATLIVLLIFVILSFAFCAMKANCQDELNNQVLIDASNVQYEAPTETITAIDYGNAPVEAISDVEDSAGENAETIEEMQPNAAEGNSNSEILQEEEQQEIEELQQDAAEEQQEIDESIAEEQVAKEEAENDALREQLEQQGTAGGVDYTSVMSIDEAKHDDQFRTVVAIVRQEGGETYEGAYAVISSAYNRCRSRKWQSKGSTIYKQLTAKGQYSWGISEYHNLCKKYLDISEVEEPCVQACYDVMYAGKGPMHNFCSFRSTSETSRKGTKILGNTYFDAVE